jgi:hypothetical protein
MLPKGRPPRARTNVVLLKRLLKDNALETHWTLPPILSKAPLETRVIFLWRSGIRGNRATILKVTIIQSNWESTLDLKRVPFLKY